MIQNSELKWRNAALKHLIIGPGEKTILDAIATLLARASGRTDGLLISDLWAKGTKNQSCAGEVDPNITRHIVTWGGREVMTIERDGSIKIVKDEQLVRLPSDGKNPPSASSSHASIVFEPLESEIERSGAARAFDEKKALKPEFKDAVSSDTPGKRL